jgi:hypothetical protein
VREWLGSLGRRDGLAAAAFDTRVKGPAWLTGHASKGIADQLRRHGCTLVAAPESFLVTTSNTLVTREASRARDWGTMLAGAVAEHLVV